MSDLLRDTIARLEVSSGDRELDALIYISVYKSAYPDETDEARIERARVCAPHYTSSIDAALALMPADSFWRVGNDGNGQSPADFRADFIVNGRTFYGIAETAPLALCIASLRARASLKARTAQ